MDKDLLKKIVGLIVVIALVGSMFAGALTYKQDEPNNPSPNDIQSSTTFEYNTSFDSKIIQDLDVIKIVVETSELNKNNIDFAVQKIDLVSKIQSSQLIGTGEEKWYYVAEINLKKKTIINDALEQIFEITYFNGVKEAMKKVSVATPVTDIDLVDEKNSFSRKYKFDYATTIALVSINSLIGDEISVDGTIWLQGNTIIGLELNEASNKTNAPKFFSVEQEFELMNVDNELFFEVEGEDFNAINYVEDLELLDETIVSAYSNFLIGKTIKENKELVEELLKDYDISFTLNGKVFVEDLTISDLNETISFNQLVDVKINSSRTIGEVILVNVGLTKTRTETSIIGAEEVLQ